MIGAMFKFSPFIYLSFEIKPIKVSTQGMTYNQIHSDEFEVGQKE